MKRVQTLRFFSAGERPVGASEGTMFVNFADGAFGCVDDNGDPVDLLAIPKHVETTDYEAGSIVAFGTGIYKAMVYVVAGAFDPLEWQPIDGPPITFSSTAPADPFDNDLWLDTDNYLLWAYDEGEEEWMRVCLDPVVLGASPPLNPYIGQLWYQTGDRGYVWDGVSWVDFCPDAEVPTIDDVVLLTGGTMTGPLNLPVTNPTAATQAAHKGYVDGVTGTKLNSAGGTVTGNLTVQGLLSPQGRMEVTGFGSMPDYKAQLLINAGAFTGGSLSLHVRAVAEGESVFAVRPTGEIIGGKSGVPSSNGPSPAEDKFGHYYCGHYGVCSVHYQRASNLYGYSWWHELGGVMSWQGPTTPGMTSWLDSNPSGSGIWGYQLRDHQNVVLAGFRRNPTAISSGFSGSMYLRRSTGSNYWELTCGDSPAAANLVAQYNGASVATLSSATGNWTSASDKRLKQNIRYGEVPDVLDLKPAVFQFKGGHQDVYGFIAQDVDEVVPGIVSEDGSEDRHLSLDYIQIIAMLVKTVKDQAALIGNLEMRVRRMEAL